MFVKLIAKNIASHKHFAFQVVIYFSSKKMYCFL